MGAENRSVDRLAVGRLGAVAERQLEAVRQRVGGEDVVTAAHERLREEQAGEAAADHEDAPAGCARLPGARRRGSANVPLRRRSRPGARSSLQRSRAPRTAGKDRRLREPRTGRLVPGPAAVALAAGQMVDERDAPAVSPLATTSWPRTVPAAAAELLDVRAAQAARDDVDQLARAVRLGHLAERRLPGFVENDRPHGGIVGGEEEGRGGGAGPPPRRSASAGRGNTPTVPAEARRPSDRLEAAVIVDDEPVDLGTPPASA